MEWPVSVGITPKKRIVGEGEGDSCVTSNSTLPLKVSPILKTQPYP